MTLDDVNSVYVGGIPYDATEEELRIAFEIYGSVAAVKIINDREVGGKCYGFVTYKNPRSAVDAIENMNGRTIGGRVVRVNEVRTRGGRTNPHRENFRRDAGRDNDRDRDGDHIYDRERFRDRNIERSRGRDRERDYERGRDFDRAREHPSDRSRDRSVHDQERVQDDDRDWERHHDMRDQDMEIDNTKNHDGSRDREQQFRNRIDARLDDHRSRELSSNASDEYQHQVEEKLEISIHKREELQNELKLLNAKVDEREHHVSDLENKCQKLEDALAAAKKLTSQRQSTLLKLHRCFLQQQDIIERLKSSEQELQFLVDTAMDEVDIGEETGNRDGCAFVNGQV